MSHAYTHYIIVVLILEFYNPSLELHQIRTASLIEQLSGATDFVDAEKASNQCFLKYCEADSAPTLTEDIQREIETYFENKRSLHVATPCNLIVASGFQFSVPPSASITKIDVTWTRKCSISEAAKDLEVRLAFNNTILSNNYASTAFWSTAEESYTYPYSVEQDPGWNRVWIPSEINSPLFAAVIQAGNFNSEKLAKIDISCVTVNITYDFACPYNCSGRGICGLNSKCVCNDGWHGAACTIAECEVQDCNKHGFCTEINKCSCYEGWSGTYCENAICPGEPQCSSNGICGNHHASCSCFSGWRGTDCSIVDCPGMPDCSAHGTCLLKNGQPHCNCVDGWDGIDCSKVVPCVIDPKCHDDLLNDNGSFNNGDESSLVIAIISLAIITFAVITTGMICYIARKKFAPTNRPNESAMDVIDGSKDTALSIINASPSSSPSSSAAPTIKPTIDSKGDWKFVRGASEWTQFKGTTW